MDSVGEVDMNPRGSSWGCVWSAVRGDGGNAGVGENSKLSNCIIDMNARIGRDVVITNSEGVQEADRPEEGYYIRSGIVVILKNATVKDGTVV